MTAQIIDYSRHTSEPHEVRYARAYEHGFQDGQLTVKREAIWVNCLIALALIGFGVILGKLL